MRLDLRLNAIVDSERAGGYQVADLAAQCVRGGATLVQLRDKHSQTRALIEQARTIKRALSPFAVPFVVNDRVDVAMAAGADGVHLGQDDMAVEDARRLLGSRAIIGLSVKSVEEAEAASLDLVDYVGSGGVYKTSSKEQENAPIGPIGLARIIAVLRRRAPDLPVCGIAGIDASNAAEVIAAGGDGVAVISALSLVADPEAAACQLRAIVDRALAKRGK
jgi:thiamine-phosphate pyrophosphorylase